MIHPFTLYLGAAFIGALAVAVLALAIFLPQASAGRLRSENKTESELKLSSLAPRVPISEIRDGLIVRRDGSFCAGWECSGVATQFADAERLEAVSAAFDAFIKGIRHPEIELQFRYLIDYETPRVLEGRKALGNCANSPAGWLEENRLSFWRSAIDAGQMRSIRLLAFVSWKPKHTWETRSPASRFAAALWQGLVQDGFGKFAKVARAALKETRTTALLQRNREEHNRLVAEFNNILETYRLGLEYITQLRLLIEPELVELVYRGLNPADRQLTKAKRQSTSLLNTDWFEGVRLLDLGGVLKAVVTLSELPEATFASLLRPLLALDFSSEVVLNVHVPDQAVKVRKLRVLLKKSLAFQLRKDGSSRRDFQAAALEKDTVDTLASAITSSQRIVEIELAVAVSTSTVTRSPAEREKAEQDLAQRVESVLQAFGQINGARGYREETALLPTFIAFLPGVHGVRKTNREFTILSGQAADFVPIETPWTGTHDGKPAFLTRTREGTFLRFDPFSRELSNGNILVTGKTGSGKSFLIKQLLLQLQVLNPRIAIVTKGADYRALVELLGGQYREISLRTKLVKNAWDLQGNSVEPDSAQIVALKLNRWTGEGVYAQLFDRETSPEFEKAEDIICYDIDGLKESPELQTAVAFTIARAIDQQIGRKDTGGTLRPTIAVFDEVWAMLADPVLGAQILNAFRTARKRYGAIIAASQGIEDFVGTGESPHTVGLAILQNTEAKFICAQLGELSRLRDVLHLSEPAVEAVKELRNVPGHFAESYVLVGNQPESSTVIQLTATPFDYWASTSNPLETDFRQKFAQEHPELSALEVIYRLGMDHPKGLASPSLKNRKEVYATAL